MHAGTHPSTLQTRLRQAYYCTVARRKQEVKRRRIEKKTNYCTVLYCTHHATSRRDHRRRQVPPSSLLLPYESIPDRALFESGTSKVEHFQHHTFCRFCNPFSASVRRKEKERALPSHNITAMDIGWRRTQPHVCRASTRHGHIVLSSWRRKQEPSSRILSAPDPSAIPFSNPGTSFI